MPETTPQANQTIKTASEAIEAKPVEAASAEPAAKQKKKTAAKRPAKKSEKIVVVKSKRKTAIARASVRKGTGMVKVNGFIIGVIEPISLRNVMLEPVNVSNMTEELFRTVDMTISVRGGGQSAQAQAVRGAIAKGLSAFAEGDTIRKGYLQYDRSMLVDDPRRVEPKKFKGPKARARFQKSYR